jgi:hypothetical protein
MHALRALAFCSPLAALDVERSLAGEARPRQDSWRVEPVISPIAADRGQEHVEMIPHRDTGASCRALSTR